MNKVNLHQQAPRSKRDETIVDSQFDTESQYRYKKRRPREEKRIFSAAGDDALEPEAELSELSEEGLGEDVSHDEFNAFNDTNLQ